MTHSCLPSLKRCEVHAAPRVVSTCLMISIMLSLRAATRSTRCLKSCVARNAAAVDLLGPFPFLTCSFQEVLIRLQWTWTHVLASKLQHRRSFLGFHRVDLARTRRAYMQHDAMDQGILRKYLHDGATFTNEHAKHRSENGSALCIQCGAWLRFHHSSECPGTAHLRAQLSQRILQLHSNRCLWFCWSMGRLCVPLWHLRGPSTFVTFPAMLTGIRWPLCIPSLTCSGRTHCCTTALKYAVLRSVCVRIWTDCLNVIRIFQRFCREGDCVRPNSRNADLVQQLVDLVQQIGLDRSSL